MSLQPVSGIRSGAGRAFLVVLVFALALVAAWAFPVLDAALNPGSKSPGLISFLGVGLSVLSLTAVLLFAGLRAVLPKSGVFIAAVFGYNALLILVKFALSPMALYAVSAGNGFFVLQGWFVYPGLAAITAILYGLAFFILYLIFHSGLNRRLGMSARMEQRFVTLFVSMFVVALVGGVTVAGAFGFIEYALTLLQVAVIGILMAFALLGALVLCTVAFREASEQAVLLRDVTLLSTFAWVGLALIAAYHILWLVVILTFISLWPLKATSAK